MVKICPKCGTQSIDDQSMFCNKCGTKFPENIPQIESNFCPKCGVKILRKESAFCNACGSPLPISQPINPPPIVKQPVPEQNVRRQPAINGEVCPVCGAIVEAGRYYCNSCGAYMKESPTPRVSAPNNMENSERKQNHTILKEKSPFLAVLVSFFIPGAGQCYTDQWKKGIALFMLAFISAILCIIVIGIIPLLIIWIYSMYDAYHAAVRISGGFVENTYNKQIVQQNRPLGKGGSSLGKVLIGLGVIVVIFIVLIAAASLSQSGSRTQTSALTTSQIKSQAQNISYSNLMRSSDTYKNSIVYFRGQIVTISTGVWR